MKHCENKDCEHCADNHFKHGRGGAHGGEAVYGLGFIGAAIFFISTAPDFWMGVLGFLKAIVWPVFMVFEALKFLIG